MFRVRPGKRFCANTLSENPVSDCACYYSHRVHVLRFEVDAGPRRASIRRLAREGWTSAADCETGVVEGCGIYRQLPRRILPDRFCGTGRAPGGPRERQGVRVSAPLRGQAAPGRTRRRPCSCTSTAPARRRPTTGRRRWPRSAPRPVAGSLPSRAVPVGPLPSGSPSLRIHASMHGS